MVERRARDEDAAQLANAFESRRDIDAVADKVVALDEHVAEVDADAIADAFRLKRCRVALRHQRLDRDGAFDRGDDRRELEHQSVADRLDNTASAACHDWPRRFASLAHRPRRARFIFAHQPRRGLSRRLRESPAGAMCRWLERCALIVIIHSIYVVFFRHGTKRGANVLKTLGHAGKTTAKTGRRLCAALLRDKEALGRPCPGQSAGCRPAIAFPLYFGEVGANRYRWGGSSP